MKLHILSDLHLEFAPLRVEKTDADVVILAGDIGLGADGVEWAKACFDVPVLYVPGNHEYYNPAWRIDDLQRFISDACIGSNVHLLDRDVYCQGGIRFIGTTLWTDLLEHPFGGVHCGVLGSDADYIRVTDDECFNDHNAQALFRKNRAWLKQELAKPFDGKTVVVTHHAPSGGSLHPQYAGNPWNSCFITDMEDLFGDNVDLWVHGHTHNSFDYEVKGTRVICNPRGYPHPLGGWENPAFKQDLLVEL